MANYLSVENLCKRYGEVVAVDGISFHIEQGEVFGLLGPNGAGKTTTIHIIAQIIAADSGTIEVGGVNLASDGRAVKEMLGLVPQDLAIYPSLTARENLQFFGGLYGLRGRDLKGRIDEVLEFVGLADAARRPAKGFSGGMKRRLNIAAGLLHRPKLLLLDEPAVGVDPQSRNFILESIRRFNTEFGITVLYTSHYMEEVEALCSRAAIIDHGRIIADDSVQALIDSHGGGAVVIHLDRDAGELATLLDGMDWIVEARADGATLILHVEKPQRTLPRVLEVLNERGARVEGLEIRRANLETVFLNLTGRSLRDE